MLFFLIELDEEQVLKDGIINLDAAHKCIEQTFAQKDITLYQKKGTVRIYTRNIDEHDFEYLWMMNGLFKKESWFQYYIKQWRFIDIDENTNHIYTDEDLFEEWVTRPPKP